MANFSNGTEVANAVEEFCRRMTCYEENNLRSLELLERWLSPEQLQQYRDHKWFECVGSDTGKTYRLDCQKIAHNIIELHEGEPKENWCVIPDGVYYLAGDKLLAQKIAIETNENASIAIANKPPVFMVNCYYEG